MKRQTYLEVNLSNFKHNINEIKKLHKDKEIIPVIAKVDTSLPIVGKPISIVSPLAILFLLI